MQAGHSRWNALLALAERAGFEPAVPFGTRALQARALGRTTLPLQLAEL